MSISATTPWVVTPSSSSLEMALIPKTPFMSTTMTTTMSTLLEWDFSMIIIDGMTRSSTIISTGDGDITMVCGRHGSMAIMDLMAYTLPIMGIIHGSMILSSTPVGIGVDGGDPTIIIASIIPIIMVDTTMMVVALPIAAAVPKDQPLPHLQVLVSIGEVVTPQHKMAHLVEEPSLLETIPLRQEETAVPEPLIPTLAQGLVASVEVEALRQGLRHHTHRAGPIVRLAHRLRAHRAGLIAHQVHQAVLEAPSEVEAHVLVVALAEVVPVAPVVAEAVSDADNLVEFSRMI